MSSRIFGRCANGDFARIPFVKKGILGRSRRIPFRIDCPVSTLFGCSFDGDAFCEVARFIDGPSPDRGGVICEQLQMDVREKSD